MLVKFEIVGTYDAPVDVWKKYIKIKPSCLQGDSIAIDSELFFCHIYKSRTECLREKFLQYQL